MFRLVAATSLLATGALAAPAYTPRTADIAAKHDPIKKPKKFWQELMRDETAATADKTLSAAAAARLDSLLGGRRLDDLPLSVHQELRAAKDAARAAFHRQNTAAQERALQVRRD